MNDNIKVGIGFLIPASAIVLFIASLYTESFLLSAFISIAGLLSWFLYSAIMQINMPSVTGNIIVLFGFLLSLAVFLSFGIKRSMFGGYEFVPEGGAGSAILLLIIVLLGILFKKSSAPSSIKPPSAPKSSLDNSHLELPAKESPSDLISEDEENYEDEEDYEYDEDYENYWDYDEAEYEDE
jgi:hypothetical protein